MFGNFHDRSIPARIMLSRQRIRYSILALLSLTFLLLSIRRTQDERSKKNSPDHDAGKTVARHIRATNGCDSLYGTQYTQILSRTRSQHCSLGSASRFDCFTHTTDSFCIGGSTIFDPDTQEFHLDCAEQHDAALRLDHLPPYMYDTGPKHVLRDHIVLGSFPVLRDPPSKYLFLVKREETVWNLWHQLMEIMSLGLTIDVLKEAIDPRTNEPFLTDEIVSRSQVVFLDGYDDGPFFGLWDMFIGNGTTARISEISSELAEPLGVVLPLAGGSNPFWQGDWKEIACGESSLLQRFASQVLQYHDIVVERPKLDTWPRRITFVDRRASRRLHNADAFLAALRSRFPHTIMQSVDFASFSFREQLVIARSTDVLIGVHGAGLTHAMFLPPGSKIVEISPPGSSTHKGFENLARFSGHGYVRCRGTTAASTDDTGDWHFDDVSVEAGCLDSLAETL